MYVLFSFIISNVTFIGVGDATAPKRNTTISKKYDFQNECIYNEGFYPSNYLYNAQILNFEKPKSIFSSFIIFCFVFITWNGFCWEAISHERKIQLKVWVIDIFIYLKLNLKLIQLEDFACISLQKATILSTWRVWKCMQ